jgi:excinuclease ABC subunit A
VSYSIPVQYQRSVTLRGVRTHNLKDIDLDLPLRHLIVVTGRSGAGKSSLAFDTVYAEGQRRYVETFSPYTRQFLAKLDKPDADTITGIPPAVAIGRSQGHASGRSTVGTISEVHDSLALLFSRVGEVVCRNCGQKVAPASPASVSQAIESWPAGTRYEIAFPLDVRAQTDRPALLRSLGAAGFTRVRVRGQVFPLETPDLALPADGSMEIIVDRLVRGSDPHERRADSIETAFANGLGRCSIIVANESHPYMRGWRCSRCGTDHLEPQPNLFRYNSALGACSVCEGLGQTIELDWGQIVPDTRKTIRQGALAPWSTPRYGPLLEGLIAQAPDLDVPVDVPFNQLSSDQIERLSRGGGGFKGLKSFFQMLEGRPGSQRNRLVLSRWRRHSPCPGCQGARLRPEALAVKILDRHIAELSAMMVSELHHFLEHAETLHRDQAVTGILAHLGSRLRCLGEIGLDYLTLDRPARTLSRGERQRVALSKTVASGLVNTLYVLDEPTAGLHPQETGRLISILHRLRDQGNTLIVVEHDHDLIRASDHVIDLGPGAGAAGGQLIYNGPIAGFTAALNSATSDYLSGRIRVPVPASHRPKSRRELHLTGARGNNLKSIDVSFPLGLFCAVTGVSGSGKTTLVERTLYPALRSRITGEPSSTEPYGDLRVEGAVAGVVLLDQSPLARSARSNPATHLKAFDEIRKTFAATHEARMRNYDAGRFSFNIEGGRCNHCQGNGFLTIDMQFLPDVMIRCPECSGTRFRPEILEVSYRGRNIAEVLELTAREAFGFFRHRPKVQLCLRPLLDIGLEYLRLGQPVSTLSGGEAQRVKLAGFLGRSLAALNRPGAPEHMVFLLDEPTAGLHPVDIVKLLEALNALVDRGHSVIVTEHSPEVMMNADWIIELGPGAAGAGGQVVAQGPPEDIARSGTATGTVLAKALGINAS